jgi:Fe-S cluster assembly protein SufD
MTIHQTAIRPALTPAERRFLDLYSDVASRLPGAGNAAVRQWREAALERFALAGLPHRRIEEWKYTDLRVLMAELHPLAGLSPAAPSPTDIEAAIGRALAALDSYRAVFIDGFFQPTLSDAQKVDGVSFQSLRKALADESGQTLAILAPRDRDTIADLAAAFATDGALLSIAPHTRLQKPFHLIFVASAGEPKLCAAQNAIRVAEGAEIALIETHASLGNHQSISSAHLRIGASASVKHVRFNGGAEAKHLSSVAAVLAEGAHYEPLQMTADGALTRAQATIGFQGPGARCHYTGAMMLRGRGHADFTLVVKHDAPNCESRETVKAVLDGHSRGVFQGKVIVERGAQKTDGKQMANALLLSDDAEFDSKPELEIYADDVVCGHGATAGQLDEDMLFYLRARGLREAEARALLIAAFVGEALDKIENEALRDALKEKVDAWLSV